MDSIRSCLLASWWQRCLYFLLFFCGYFYDMTRFVIVITLDLVVLIMLNQSCVECMTKCRETKHKATGFDLLLVVPKFSARSSKRTTQIVKRSLSSAKNVVWYQLSSSSSFVIRMKNSTVTRKLKKQTTISWQNLQQEAAPPPLCHQHHLWSVEPIRLTLERGILWGKGIFIDNLENLKR